jgi:hypothetical protein
MKSPRRIITDVRDLGRLVCLLIAVLPGFALRAQADGAGDLAERLGDAILQVEAARDRGIPLGDPGALFPESEEVTGPAGEMRVDHTGLREEWRHVPAEGDARHESLERLRRRLVAVRAEVVSAYAAVDTGAPPPGRWRERLAEVMRRPEFGQRRPEEDWRAKLMRWLWEKLGFLLPRATTQAVGDALSWILYAAALFALAAILVPLIRAARPLFARDRRRGRVPTASTAGKTESREALLAQADACARAGDLRGAAQATFRWMLLELQRAGRLDYDPALTNREHLARLKAEDRIRTGFERLSRQFELVWYGFQPVGPEDLARFRAECRRLAGGRA